MVSILTGRDNPHKKKCDQQRNIVEQITQRHQMSAFPKLIACYSFTDRILPINEK